MKPLQPEQFRYQGFFRLPDRRGRPAHEKFAYGGHAMCYNPANDSLFVAGHEHHDLVAEITIPMMGYAPGARESDAVLRPQLVREFFDPAPFRTLAERKRLDTLGGLELIDGWLYSSWFGFYEVGGAAKLDLNTLAMVRSDLGAERPRLYHIGPKTGIPFTQKATSGYMFRIPDEWSAANGIPSRILACGRGDGAGNATSPKGPALFAVNPATPENATVLLYRGAGQEPPGWTPCDRWHGGAWIRAGEYEGVVFVGEVATAPWWYGTADMPDEKPEWFVQRTVQGQTRDWRDEWREKGIRDTWRPGGGSKGYHTTRRQVRLQSYDPWAFREALKTGDTVRSHYWNYAPDVFHEAARPGACAYDETGRCFFVWEHWPPEKGSEGYPNEDPRIHVWKVEVPKPDKPDKPKPPSEPKTLAVEAFDGEHRWTGTLEKRS